MAATFRNDSGNFSLSGDFHILLPRYGMTKISRFRFVAEVCRFPAKEPLDLMRYFLEFFECTRSRSRNTHLLGWLLCLDASSLRFGAFRLGSSSLGFDWLRRFWCAAHKVCWCEFPAAGIPSFLRSHGGDLL